MNPPCAQPPRSRPLARPPPSSRPPAVVALDADPELFTEAKALTSEHSEVAAGPSSRATRTPSSSPKPGPSMVPAASASPSTRTPSSSPKPGPRASTRWFPSRRPRRTIDPPMRLAPVLVVAVTAALGGARPAAAKSCIRHAYERLVVEAVAVYVGDRKVEPPPELGALDELLNSSGGGKSVLFWHASTMEPAKFYGLERPFPPTPAVAAYLDASRRRELLTGCGYHVRYTPLAPGRYVFQEEHRDGSRVPKGIAEPVLLVAPGRDVVELRFRIGDRRYRAVYRVRCASFEWEPADQGRCAPSEPTADLEAVLASATAQDTPTPPAQDTPTPPTPTGAGEAASDVVASDPAAPENREAEPTVDPPREPPRVIASPPEEPPPTTARGCSVDAPASTGLLALALLALRRRRRPAARPATRERAW